MCLLSKQKIDANGEHRCEIIKQCVIMATVANYLDEEWFKFITSDVALRDNPNKWDRWNKICSSSNLTMSYVENHPEIQWDLDGISRNPNITMEIINKYYNNWLNFIVAWFRRTSFDWGEISRNPNITMQNIIDHPDLPWDWNGICLNPNITVEMIRRYSNVEWSWGSMSWNKSANLFDIIDAYPDSPWDWFVISQHPHLTIEFIQKYIDKRWDIHGLCAVLKITQEIIDANNIIGKQLCWSMLSTNKSVTMEIIQNNMDRPWNWMLISYNPNLTMDMAKNNLDKQWSVNGISQNSNITMQNIINNPNIPWLWQEVSKNPNLTIQMVRNNPDKEWLYVYENEFLLDRKHRELRLKNILLSFIHDYYVDNPFLVVNLVEYVLFDCYILMCVGKY